MNSDVFISYSRKDKEFVGRLRAALTDLDRKVWIDWENIPLTADWWKEICAGIESTDTFVFIISPDSVASPICNLEIAHAVRHRKRLVPVVHLPVDDKQAFAELAARQVDDNVRRTLAGRDLLAVARDNWQLIARHNWLFFADVSDFDRHFQSLISALDTDLEHVKMHTRLIVRANEWERSANNASFLLRGDDLLQAETWQATATSADKDPQPTPLQAQFILTSRRATHTRQRILLAGVSIALIVALGLAALSAVLAQQAESRRIEADNNAQTAVAAESAAEQNLQQALETQSLFLADLSQQELAGDRSREGLALSLEALAHYPDVYTQESAQALLDALHAPAIERYGADLHDPHTGKWVEDQGQFISLERDGFARLWDLETGVPLLELQHSGTPINVDWHENLLAATVPDQGEVYLWDMSEGDTVPLTILNTGGVVNVVAFNADGTQLMGNSSDYFALWDVNSRALLTEYEGLVSKLLANNTIALLLDSPNYPVVDLYTHETLFTITGYTFDVHPALEYIAYGAESQDVIVWNPATRDEIARLETDAPIARTYWSADGSRLLAVTETGTGSVPTVYLWDSINWELILRQDISASTYHDAVSISPDGRYILAQGDELHLWDNSSGGQTPLWTTESAGSRQTPIWKDERVLLWSGNQGVMVWNIATGVTEFVIDPDFFISGVLWDNPLLIVRGSDSVQVHDTFSHLLVTTFYPEGQVLGLWWNDERTNVYTFSNSLLQAWDITGGLQRTWRSPVGVYDLAVDTSGGGDGGDEIRLIGLSQFHQETAIEYGVVHVWEGDTLRHTLYGYNPITDMSHKGSRLVTWTLRDESLLWSTDTGELLSDLGQTIEGVSWNADGSRFLTYGTVATVWDSQSGETLLTLVQPLADDRFGLSGAAWSPDETRILTWGNDPALYVWDAAGGEILYTLTHAADVWKAAWSADGSQIITSDDNDDFYVWDAATGERLFYADLTLPELDFIVLPPQTSTQGRLLAATSGGDTYLWDISSGDELLHLQQEDFILDVRWNDDETRLLTASRDGTAVVWDVETGARLLTLTHELGVRSATWNADETLILTVSSDGTAGLWKADDGTLVQRLKHPGIAGARWHADDTQIITYGSDGTIRAWTYDFDTLLSAGRGQNFRPLNQEERRRYFLAVSTPVPPP